MLGLPEDDLPMFQERPKELLYITNNGNDELMEPDATANDKLIDYFQKLIAEKKQNPAPCRNFQRQP